MVNSNKFQNLIERAKNNKEEAAFNELFNLFWDDIYYFILSKTRNNKEQAKDITCVTFTKAYLNIDTFKIEKNFKNWLITISYNILRDEKKSKRNVLINATSIDDIDIEDETESSLQGMIYQENLISLQTALEELKEIHKEIIKLRYFEDMSIKEIATKLGVTEGSIRTKIHRIKEKLSKIIRK